MKNDRAANVWRPAARPTQATLTGVCVAAALAMTGCGSIPDATVSYYLPKSSVNVKVTRSVLCDEKNNPFVADTVTATVQHSANADERREISLAQLRGVFSDSDVKFEMYEDGRLKGINASSTGQAEAIVKAAAMVATTAVGFNADAAANSPRAGACATVKAVGGGKPVTLIFQKDVSFGVSGAQMLQADASSRDLAVQIASLYAPVCLMVAEVAAPKAAPVVYTPKEGDVLLEARQPAWVTVNVGAVSGEACSAGIWTGQVSVSQLGVKYVLPLPKAAAFGKQGVGVVFMESGAIGSVQYLSNTGAGGVLNATNTLLTSAQGESAGTKAANLKAEADIVLHQQRLLKCRAEPKTCV